MRADSLWPDKIPNGEELTEAAREAIGRGEVQVVLRFPHGFEEQLAAVRESLLNRSDRELGDLSRISTTGDYLSLGK